MDLCCCEVDLFLFLRALFLFFTVVSCSSTPATLTSDPISDVAKLNEKYQLVARVGSMPVTLDGRDSVVRYSLKPKGKRAIFLVIISPQSAKGEIKIPVVDANKKNGKNTDDVSLLGYSESAVEYNEYIDLMLRAQRQILRGQIAKAKESLGYAQMKYDESYASLVLKGTIALVKGDSYLAAQLFKAADRLFSKGNVAILKGD